jgi:predicted DNA-binding transcriptional regulator AlpA
MENRGELPPRFKISTRAVGWLESDIEEWLLNRSKSSIQIENKGV